MTESSMAKELGLIYVFTGEGKGKTSAAVGTAVRAVGVGMKVAWVAWYKQANWRLAEIEMLKNMGVEVILLGKGFHIKNSKSEARNSKLKTKEIAAGAKVVDMASDTEHRQAAEAALHKAAELVKTVDVMILDEVNNAIADKLIQVSQVLQVIQEREKTHIILTGRDAHPDLIKKADLVTEMKKVKHPYDTGKLAVRGLDF